MAGEPGQLRQLHSQPLWKLLPEAFQLRVIAEGVETSEHRDMLLKMGCELGLGHVFAHLIKPEIVIEWMNG